MTYQTAFPDYDNALAAESLLAHGWKDESWHNDVCPSFSKGRCAIFVDYLDAEKREIPEAGPVCTVIVIDAEGCYSEYSHSFESVSEAMLFADEVTNELRGETSIPEVLKWVRFRLQISTVDEARDIMDDEAASARPCPQTLDHCASVILAYWIGQIGLGFHLDTRGCDYAPKLEHEADYDMDMHRAMACNDPYAIALDIMAKL